MSRWFPLTRYNTELFKRSAFYVFSRQDQRWANDFNMTRDACVNPPRGQIDSFPKGIPPSDVARIRKQLEGLRLWLSANGHNTRIVLVLAPFYSVPQTDGEITRMRMQSDTVFVRNGYFDLSRALPPNCDFFADATHINRAGRAQLREKLITYARLLTQ